VQGADSDRERNRRGAYVITVLADAFGQIEEVRKDNKSASVRVAVQDTHVKVV
jgi:hypothetical protein